MKFPNWKIFLLDAGLTLLPLMMPRVLSAQAPWQSIQVLPAADIAGHFKTPPPEYGMTVWWGWDGPITAEVISRDLDAFLARGIRVVTIEAGYGMKDPYLSPGWFETIKLAVEQAQQHGMRVWLVDEGKYPSGFAGGKFSTERPDFRMQGLLVAERIPAAPGETVYRQLPAETVGAIAINQADKSSQRLEVRSGPLQWTAPEGKWEVLIVQHQFRTSVTRAVNNPSRGKDDKNSLCDYLNPAATRQFLEFIHEQYKKYVGAEFGKTVLGFRGDEPDFAYTPWTPALPEEFERRKGYDVRPYLASFFAPQLTQDVQRVKADYWDVWSDLFSENFFRVQADWCAAHNLEYLVHLNHEDQMTGLVRSEGDFFKAMRYVQMPGIDTIWNQIWPDKVADFPKYASSAAHLFGRPRAFSESFAAYRTAPTVEQARWVINQQLVRGINMLEVMFVPASANGQSGLSGWMASEQFPAVVTYVNRATYLLSQGRPVVQIGLYHPTTSLWLGVEEADKSTLATVQKLLEQQRDFDFVDEQALSSVLTLQKGIFKSLSGTEYRTILIPNAGVISQTALNRLQAFAKAGGRVVFLGRTPNLVSEKSFLKATPLGQCRWAVLEPSGELTQQVMAALPEPDVVFNQPAAAVKYLHRCWSDVEMYFFFNESDKNSLCRRRWRARVQFTSGMRLWEQSQNRKVLFQAPRRRK
jgi:hypothetical protein